jgi:hypothetical protein
MKDYGDEDGGEESAIQSILDMLDDKGGELMREKHGPKDEVPVAHGHVVTVEIKPHAPDQEGGKDEGGLTEEMLEKLLGDEDGDEAKE